MQEVIDPRLSELTQIAQWPLEILFASEGHYRFMEAERLNSHKVSIPSVPASRSLLLSTLLY